MFSSATPWMTCGSSIGLCYVLSLWKLVKHPSFLPTWVGFKEQETKPGSREELSRETLKFTNITAADFGFPQAADTQV